MKIIRTASLSVLLFLAFISSAASAKLLDKMAIWVKTADVSRAGTDADLYLIINTNVPRDGTGFEYIYKLPNLRGNDTERGKTDKFVIKILDDIPLYKISGLTLVNGMNKRGPAWRLESILIVGKIRITDDNRYNIVFYSLTDGKARGTLPVPINKWLDTKKNRSPALVIPYQLRTGSNYGAEKKRMARQFKDAVPVRRQ